jgi:hypothetical protein
MDDDDEQKKRWMLMGFEDDGLPPAGFRGTEEKLRFGPIVIEPETEYTMEIRVEKPFRPGWLCVCVPFGVFGVDLVSIQVDGVNLLMEGAYPPIELFSVASTFPALVWPTFEPEGVVAIAVNNRSKTRHRLSGAFFGNYNK